VQLEWYRRPHTTVFRRKHSTAVNVASARAAFRSKSSDT
jgi:hypothetical protein